MLLFTKDSFNNSRLFELPSNTYVCILFKRLLQLDEIFEVQYYHFEFKVQIF